MDYDDDMDLLRRWRDGDRQAGDTLIRRHYGYALRLARRRLTNEDAAVEATQNAMAVLVQKRDAIDSDFRRYLSKVVYFSVLNQTKQRPYEPVEGNEAVRSAPRGASTMVGHKEEEKLMVKALRSLPIDDQLVFYYDFVGEKTRVELAELLEMTRAQIDRRVHTAKLRLRKQLETFRDSPVRQSTLGGLETWLKSMHGKVT